MTRYIVVSGGVISGIGKGVIDAGTMAPTEHGEVYVLNDGGEVDLDLGNYERYLDVTLSRDNNITTGKIYREVIEKERRGDYLGKTVQIVPHVTNGIQDWIERVSKVPVDSTGEEPDVCIIELGGTVGDIESAPFIEAMRQFQFRVGTENFALIHVSLVVDMHGEQKTKPTQSTVRDLRGLGLLPDLVACRVQGREPLDTATKAKISMFCHVAQDQVLSIHDVSSVYHVPLLLKSQGLVEFLQRRLNLASVTVSLSLKANGEDLHTRWRAMTRTQERLFESVNIVLVGKYTSLKDSYMSVVKSLEHSAFRCNRKLILEWVDSSDLEPHALESSPVRYHDAWRALVSAQGVLVPGGFGERGTEGMILAAKWAREQSKPFLGICLGFQIAVIEWARNVCGWVGANSEELDPRSSDHVIVFMPEISKTHLGGTMRLGLRPTIFNEGTETWSKMRKLYGGAKIIWERHRHRYEVGPAYVERLEKSGMNFIGRDEKGERMQVFELQDHPFYVGLQAHPEFCTRPLNPSPPFLGFVAAASSVLEEILSEQKNYRSPHPKSAMVFPDTLGASKPADELKAPTNGVVVNGH
ncbi:P-loop containing nucleoside triphosphate hydrolase protein [Cantharellus anzutake]|uniref:P-loop containing nucleoside triphosphate hydrolase protein n=1 Tax=Cantharellus anzutake TaxID=1750568 RepID=UPI001905F201|nr:P-loop containing nucleoside triphosphate hydrolase protein [Cantharellus anzutake]KAF8329396.1 P-loop containing nucleoside triphosphate hydrolase protein [Cantharellus anzutake]